ncbi:hypothetical protein PG993_009214 [Apiospora rasikravindrae]|uniref:Uncharacterized protein n=1 Tax=Apiospora rasikravindrae TaxID=990691 RepID=A0ABR1SKK1_9PEZI
MSDSDDDKPTILLLCLGDQWMRDKLDSDFRSSIETLLEKANLKRAKTLRGSLKYLNEHRPDGIIVTDNGVLSDDNRELLGRVVAFAQYGGTVVFSFCFASVTGFDQVKRLWQTSWGFPWTMSISSHRAGFHVNTSALRITADAVESNTSKDGEEKATLLLP